MKKSLYVFLLLTCTLTIYTQSTYAQENSTFTIPCNSIVHAQIWEILPEMFRGVESPPPTAFYPILTLTPQMAVALTQHLNEFIKSGKPNNINLEGVLLIKDRGFSPFPEPEYQLPLQNQIATGFTFPSWEDAAAYVQNVCPEATIQRGQGYVSRDGMRWEGEE